jgi:phosphate transport system permease protein
MASAVNPGATAAGRGRAAKQRDQVGDQIARLVVLIFAASIVLVAALIVWVLWFDSAPSRRHLGWGFLLSSEWNPVSEHFGGLPFIYGTVVTSVLALVIAIPLGVGSAIFLSELATPRISSGLTFLIELLAAIPSVIYGLLAMFSLVPLMRIYIEPLLRSVLGFLPWFQGIAYGVGYLTAGVILAIMTLPFIISVSRESLMAVPREQREAALALGSTKWEATWQVVVPHARLGILGSIFLGLARALGETMAVTMVIGNSTAIHASLFAPGNTIAAVIANEFAEATGDVYKAVLVELGLVLFCLTIILNGAARLMMLATTRKGSKRE